MTIRRLKSWIKEFWVATLIGAALGIAYALLVVWRDGGELIIR